MNSFTVPAAFTADIFSGGWKLRMFPAPGLTPGFKLEPPFLWEFPASLGRASLSPAAKAVLRIRKILRPALRKACSGPGGWSEGRP
ncbi:MAG: hypothetical protein LBB26_04560 [Puniceicoccales bacterium]|nr:hypothetical protein [Puniceicoccales bacterium]